MSGSGKLQQTSQFSKNICDCEVNNRRKTTTLMLSFESYIKFNQILEFVKFDVHVRYTFCVCLVYMVLEPGRVVRDLAPTESIGLIRLILADHGATRPSHYRLRSMNLGPILSIKTNSQHRNKCIGKAYEEQKMKTGLSSIIRSLKL